jgi:hypothetical protein
MKGQAQGLSTIFGKVCQFSKGLLLLLYNNKAIYSWLRIVFLREIAIQEVHPKLGGSAVNRSVQVVQTLKEGLGI